MVIMNNTALLWTVICTFLLQFRSVAQPCPTLCDPMDCSMPGLPVHHQLPELAETSVHLVGDAIQPSHSLLCPSLPAFNLFQHQSLFQWVGSSHQVQFSSVQLLSHVRLLATSLSITNSWNLPKLKSIELVMPSNHLIFCHPLLILPSIFPIMRVLSNESALCIRWLQYWSFSISPSNEYSGLISFRMDWLDLLAVQGTLKSLIQHHSSKHQFFGTQLSL